MIEEIVAGTEEALRGAAELRFLRTERGFHGRFYCALQCALESRGLLRDGIILEMEYQKSARHGMSQRPDTVLHVPTEYSSAAVTENNFAVWALKRQANAASARADFEKLDQMFQDLRYPLGIFINIDSKENFAAAYNGRFSERFRAVAVWRDGDVATSWGRAK